MSQASRTKWHRDRQELRSIPVCQKAFAHALRHLAHLRLPRASGDDDRYCTVDFLGEELQEVLLVAHVPVQRRGLDAESLRESPHREGVQADIVEQRKRGSDNLRLIQSPTFGVGLDLPVWNDAHEYVRAGKTANSNTLDSATRTP